MAQLKSSRAQKILSEPRFFTLTQDPLMRKFPGEGGELWLKLDWEGELVKKLSFFGKIEDVHMVFLESMANLLIGKPISKLDDLSLRECEAFLRDRNSLPSISEMTEREEIFLKKVFHWVRVWPRDKAPLAYQFHSENGRFQSLKLVDKIREIKAFLNSPEILTLYQGMPLPELVDVEELTVFLLVPYQSQRERGLFEKLHLLGVEVFQEENLNFIPEVP
jgi:hypothetical protein